MIRIAQISDTHLSDAKPFFIANFEATIRDVAANAFDLVINTGDLALNGADLGEDLEAARRLQDATGLGIVSIPGNHDIGDNRETTTKQPFDLQRRARWLSLVGPDFWMIDKDHWRILAINSLMLGSDLDGEGEQDAFIRAAVADIGDRHLALFLHKPMFDQSAEETDVSGRWVNPEPRRRLLAALGTVTPKLVACGHVHQFRDTTVDGTRHIWAPGTSFVVPEAFQPTFGERTSGYVAHELHDDGRVESRLVMVPDMPVLNLIDFPEAYGDLNKLMTKAAAE